MVKNSRNTKKNLKNDICYFCKKPLTNYNDWCYIEKPEKAKAHYKCIAEHQF
ncbi:MAG: hypothetical protein QXM07_04335 [Nitrososphaerota archaeon]